MNHRLLKNWLKLCLILSMLAPAGSKGEEQVLSTFFVGNADALITTPPQTELAKQQGYPVIIDYYKEGLKIIGPGTAVTREFAQKHPNTIKTFLMA
jgi:ABC-type nitrate/sulfonate/bicarbonate transport system substrate-binding protein